MSAITIRQGENRSIRIALFVFAVILLSAYPGVVHAQNSLGLGNAEQAIRPDGPFSSILMWIQQEQKAFYKSMTDALKQMRSDPSAGWVLVGLSFLYGVFHAAGPGHGKAVISSYMLANEVALRRGIYLSFASAMLQAVTAVVMIGSIALVFRGMGLKSGELANRMEIMSYAGITLLGAWLLWRKAMPVIRRRFFPAPASHGGDHHHHHHDHLHDHAGEDGNCSTCGHSHAPDPSKLSGDLNLKEAWGAIFAVGLRPCSGALIVLTFAFLNGMYLAGIASTFAMAAGTGLTVAILASLAAGAKNAALRISGASQASAGVLTAIEIAGAGMVLGIGVLLLSAALYG